MNRLIAVCLIIFLAGCATSSDIYLPDGSKGLKINCDGAVQDFGACMQKAGEECGSRGYSIINQSGEAVPFSIASGQITSEAGAFQAQSGAVITRSLLVKCNK